MPKSKRKLINMNKILLLFATGLILLSSCNREDFFQKRLEGKWVYERACYQKNALKQEDILDDYKNLEINFNLDGTLEISNTTDSVFYTGLYEIDDDYNTNANQDGTATGSIDIVLSYEDNTSGEKFLEVWDQSNIGKKKIRFQRQIDGKRANFVLIKQ